MNDAAEQTGLLATRRVTEETSRWAAETWCWQEGSSHAGSGVGYCFDTSSDSAAGIDGEEFRLVDMSLVERCGSRRENR